MDFTYVRITGKPIRRISLQVVEGETLGGEKAVKEGSVIRVPSDFPVKVFSAYVQASFVLEAFPSEPVLDFVSYYEKLNTH